MAGLRWAAAVLAAACTLGVARAAVPEKGAARVLEARGTVEVRRSGTDTWAAATVGQALEAGDAVRTGTLSRAAVLLSDETQVRLNQNTLLVVRSSAGRGGPDARTELDLQRGRAWTRATAPPGGLTVTTPSASAAIRGTEWELEVAEDGRSTLTVLQGEVAYSNAQGALAVGRNQQAVAEVGRAPAMLVLANPRDRVQWVTAYAVEPLQHVALGDGTTSAGALEPVAGETAEALVRRGGNLADLGRWKEAAAAFTRAAELQPSLGNAELGLGFVALRESAPAAAAERLQAARQAGADPELLALGEAAVLVEKGDLAPALAGLERLAAEPRLAQPAAFLLLSDLMLATGQTEAAVRRAEQGLARFPDHPRLHAQLATVLLASGRGTEARGHVARALRQAPGSIEALLAQGRLARFDGDAAGASEAYARARALRPFDSRGWHGGGVVDTEREDVRRGTRKLERALELDPRGAGYQGELGTLHALANRLGEAEEAFRAALVANPADYVARTGLGLLQLKRGRPAEALGEFRQASLMEPRFARAHVYAAVAEYQLGHRQTARGELDAARELDPRDPFPSFLGSMMSTDAFEARQAADEGRTALELMPHLKSLNQILNDQRGTANLGSSFAQFGLEEWAQNLAQESYHPYWAGSHLFLADRYPGLFAKNSELFQGFLTDPTVFGASNRFQTILPRPGLYATAGSGSDRDDTYTTVSPFLTVSGRTGGSRPLAFFADATSRRFLPADELKELASDEYPYDGREDTATAALGFTPTADLGVFAFGRYSELTADFDVSEPFEGESFRAFADLVERTKRLDAGLHDRLSPVSQLWVKAGVGRDRTTDEYQEVYGGVPFPEEYRLTSDLEDVALRQTSTFGRLELTLGAEWSRQEETEAGAFIEEYEDEGEDEDDDGDDDEDDEDDDDGEDESAGAARGASRAAPTQETYPVAISALETTRNESLFGYVSLRYPLSRHLEVEGGLFVQRQEKGFDFQEEEDEDCEEVDCASYYQEDDAETVTRVKPRAGLVVRFGRNRLLRLVYQDWFRPASLSTLSPVATAGIPLEDRYVTAGAQVRRGRAQLEWEWSPRLFTSAFAEASRSENFVLASQGLVTPPRSLQGLENLQQQRFVNLARADVLEETPEFNQARFNSAGLAVNAVATRRLSAYARYTFTDTENREESAELRETLRGRQVAFVPRHAVAVGATLVAPLHAYVSAQAVYRSRRFTDEANTYVLPAGWDVSLNAFWESKNKRYYGNLRVSGIAYDSGEQPVVPLLPEDLEDGDLEDRRVDHSPTVALSIGLRL